MKNIRIASEEDASKILKIYAPYITATSFTFELDVPKLNDFKKRINNYVVNWPWLVCETDGQMAGYAYASLYRERMGYQWSVECSVYIDDIFQRRGVAHGLYQALLAILKLQGYVNVYAVINLPNPKSVTFHEAFGFTWQATYNQVGYKLGKWKDVGWWQIRINDPITEPQSPIKFSMLNTSDLSVIFKEALKNVR